MIQEPRDFQTCKIQNPRPKSSRNPENHHGMNGTDGVTQTRTTTVTASSRRTYGPGGKEWTMRRETRGDQTA